MQFAASLSIATNAANRQVSAWLRDRGLGDTALADDLDERLAQVGRALEGSDLYPASTLSADWLWANHGRIGTECLEEILPEVEEQLEQLNEGPATLTVKSGFEKPDYYARQWFHNTTGGWDGHDYMGTIQSEFVHKRYVAAKYGPGLYALRRRLLDELPQHDFQRIMEMGTSAGYFTRQIADKFPEAEIHGCDVSRRMLEQARRVANELGQPWHLLLAPAEATGLPAGSFDLVTSYALFHELPGPVIEAVWREAWRLLKPGGYAFMADGIPQLGAIDRLAAWRFCHDWQRGGEPYARDYATMDDAAAARAAGFVDVVHRSLEDRPIPRYTLARKPASGGGA